MDSSGSIGGPNFVIMKSFVKQIFQSLDIGENNTRAALLHFENRVYEDFNFLNFKSKANIEKIIDAIIYSGGGTNTASALEYTNDIFYNISNGMRDGNFFSLYIKENVLLNRK